MSEHVSVSIPKRLYEEIKKKVDESLGEFTSVEEYIEFVLTEVVKEDDEAAHAEGVQMSEKEEDVDDRKRKLSHI